MTQFLSQSDGPDDRPLNTSMCLSELFGYLPVIKLAASWHSYLDNRHTLFAS